MSQKYGLSAQNMLIKFKGFVFVVVVAVVVVFWVRGIPKVYVRILIRLNKKYFIKYFFH